MFFLSQYYYIAALKIKLPFLKDKIKTIRKNSLMRASVFANRIEITFTLFICICYVFFNNVWRMSTRKKNVIRRMKGREKESFQILFKVNLDGIRNYLKNINIISY